jgi:hypothetical protein
MKLVSDYLSGHSLASATFTGKKTNKALTRREITTDIPEPGQRALGVGQMLPSSRWLDVPYHALQVGRALMSCPFDSFILIHLNSLRSEA